MMNATTACALTENAINKRKACQAVALETAIAESASKWENSIATCASLCVFYTDLDTQKAYNKVIATLAPVHAMSHAEVNEAIADYMRSYGYTAEVKTPSAVRVYW